MNIHGLHHVTAVTAHAKQNVDFYTNILGLRLVKKTVNQDDVSAYHLFYADKQGTPGTDMTFFDWPAAGPKQSATDSITTTMFRVHSVDSIDYWQQRFKKLEVEASQPEVYGQSRALRFYDPEGQELMLIEDGMAETEAAPWDDTVIPTEHRLKGFYAIRLSVPSLQMVDPILTRLLKWEKQRDFADSTDSNKMIYAYAIDGGGPGKEVHVTEQSGMPGWTTAGSVHHAAFRVENETELEQWKRELDEVGLGNSGIVDRFYFKSLYFRITPGILFELATDGPGFAADEPIESLGERLSLPPFLEHRRSEIESGLEPLTSE